MISLLSILHCPMVLLKNNLLNQSNKMLIESAIFIWLVTVGKQFFTSENPKRYNLWSCQTGCDALYHLLDDIFTSLAIKLYRQIVGFPMDTKCASLVADLFLFCFE